MARIRFPTTTSSPIHRRYRLLLHTVVVLLALGAVLFAARHRLTGDDEGARGGAGTPTPESRAAVLPPSPAATVPSLAAPSPSPTPSASPVPSASPTPSPSPIATPSPEPTPEATPEPMAEPPPSTPRPAPLTPAPPPAPITARAVDTASLRNGPSSDALITGFVPAGATVSVIGCVAGCSWLQVTTAGGAAWSARYFWTVTGDLSTLGGR